MFSNVKSNIILIIHYFGAGCFHVCQADYDDYTPRFNEVDRRVYWYHLVRLSEETSLDHDQTGPKTSPEPHRRIADPHRRITINILEILELPIFAYHTYYTSKHMYNWMKWLRLLGGWHFIAATAIKPPKAACQFAADDILLYKICYNIQWIYFTIWEKGKEELSPLQYHFKSLHIISRHYKKSLLRSQIYHGYEELSTDTNYPIWRRQKLPYMKKTRKKKQVCGAACFMAAEIKFSEDVRLSVRQSVRLWTESCPLCIFNNTHRIHFIFAHLIEQFKKVCRV